MGASPTRLHHPQVTPNATGYSSALPEQLFTLKRCTVCCGGSPADWQTVQLGTGTSHIFSNCTQSASSSCKEKYNDHQEKDKNRKAKGESALEHHKDLASVRARQRYQN